MKKIIFLLFALISMNVGAQVIVHNQPVKLKQLAVGTNADSLVVVDNDGLTKFLPISSIQISPEVAIVAEDEGNGLTYFPQGQDRTYMGVGGAGALNFSFADNVAGGYGGTGDQSLTFGYNVKNAGYGAFMIGEDSEVLSSGTYSIAQGYGNSIGGYTSVGIGTYLTAVPNYTFAVGHTVDIQNGGGTIALGTGILEDSTADRMVILGQGNIDPQNINGFASNNVGGMIGVGDLSGAGATPFVRVTPKNAITWFRDADAGVVQLDETALATIDAKKATFPQMIPTVEYVDREVANASGEIPSLVAFTDTQDVTDNLITMNGNQFLHNYGGGAIWEKNLFLGENAGNFSVTGKANGFFGNEAGASLTTGAENWGFGNETLALVTTGGMNTAFGSAAGYSMVAGSRNSFFGRQSGVWLTTGSNNTFFGSTSGFTQVGGGNLTDIDQATLIGSYVDATQGSTNETVIGYNANGSGSNTVTIGNDAVTDTYIKGDMHFTGDLDLGALLDRWVGNTSATSNQAKIGFFSSGMSLRVYDGTTDYMDLNLNNNPIDEALELTFYNAVGTRSAVLRYMSPADQMQFFGTASVDLGTVIFYNSASTPNVDFNKSTVGDVGFQNSNINFTSVVDESKAGTLVFLTDDDDGTYTIPDTWTQKSGAQITFVNIGGGTATIAVSGTATLNDSGANTIVLPPADSTGNSACQLVQQVNESDDWFSIGKY